MAHSTEKFNGSKRVAGEKRYPQTAAEWQWAVLEGIQHQLIEDEHNTIDFRQKDYFELDVAGYWPLTAEGWIAPLSDTEKRDLFDEAGWLLDENDHDDSSDDQKTGSMVRGESIQITNLEFLKQIFGKNVPPNCGVAVCSKQGDPGVGGWYAERLTARTSLTASSNNYFCCGSFRLDGERIQAKKEKSALVHAIMFDDIGTKVPHERMGDFELSWLIETSPGNYQGGVIFAEPITAKEADDLNERIIAAGLCDDGARSPASRWCRLPEAINGKPKYTQTDGSAFECRLVKWNPEKRYKPQEINAGLNLSVSSAYVGKLHHLSRIGAGAAAIKHDGDDPVVAALKAGGLYKRELRNGAHDITCPWVEEHTDHIDDGAAYFPPSAANPHGGFKCHHGHGAELNITKLKSFLQLPENEAAKFDALVLDNKREAQKLEKAAIRALINDTEKDDAVAAFVRVMVSDGADSIISKSDESLLIAEVAKKSGAEKRAIKAELAEARAKRNSRPSEESAQDNEAFDPERERLLAAMQALNKDYCYVSEEGVTTIIRDDYNPIRKIPVLTRQSTTDFVKDLLPIKFSLGTRKNAREPDLGTQWLHWDGRRQYLGGVVFDPGAPCGESSANGRAVRNLWTGFGVEPAEGECTRILAHLLYITCSGNNEHYDYVIKLLANAVQNPDKQGMVCIIMRGKKGAGKSIIARLFTSLFGAHGMIIQNTDHLTGRFNEHLQLTVALFVEEAPFAGDLRNENVLKSLVTDETIVVEPKYRKAVEISNYLHIMMASNEDYVVHATGDERRYCVLDVSDAKICDFKYFADLHDEIENGGREAFLHHLMNIDLTGFNVRDYPETEALDSQKLASLPIECAWMRDVLDRGYVAESENDLTDLEQWHRQVSYKLVEKSFESYVKARGKLAYVRGKKRHIDLLKQLGAVYDRTRRHGEVVLGEVNLRYGEGSLLRDKGRPYCFFMPELAKMRANFEKICNVKVDWTEREDRADQSKAQSIHNQIADVMRRLDEIRTATYAGELDRDGAAKVRAGLEQAGKTVSASLSQWAELHKTGVDEEPGEVPF